MTKFDDDMLDGIILRRKYEDYRARCNDIASTTGRKPTFPMSFDDWWRAAADNAKDEAKYHN